jgi:hypothetical protein
VLVVTKENELYEWGALKMSHPNVVVRNARDVEVRGELSYYVDMEGKVYRKVVGAKLKPLPFPSKIHISLVVSSFSFTHFLTVSGQLYSLGCNKLGLLGL